MTLLVTAACGDDAPPAGDSGPPPGDATFDARPGPALPMISWLEAGEPPVAPPALDCPDGWRVAVSSTGVETCDAYAAAGPDDCADGEAHFPGEPGCAPVGDPCPATGDWPTGLPTDRPIAYVRGGAPAGGDGSMASPYQSIGHALADHDPPVTIALARGRQLMTTTWIRGDTRVVGVCAGGTTLENGGTEWLINARGTGNEIRNLTLVGAGVLVNGLSAPAEAVIEGVEVRLGRGAGVGVAGDATATVRSLLVRDSRGNMSDESIGAGVFVTQGAGPLTLSRAVLENNHLAGVIAETGASVTIEDIAIRNTDFQIPDGAGGDGIVVRTSATMSVARAVLENNAWSCGTASSGATLDVEDVVCRGAPGRASDGRGGGGLVALDGASLTVRRAVVERFQNFGIGAAGDPGASALVEDVVLRDSRAAAPGSIPSGFGFDGGSTGTLSRVHVEGVHGMAMFSFAPVDASDITIVDTLEQDGADGLGVFAGDFSQVSLARAIIRGSRQYGILVQNGGEVDLVDVLVADSEGRSLDGLAGSGLAVFTGATARAERVLLVNNRGGALVSGEGSTADFMDLVVRDSRPEAASNDFGRGLTVQSGATATMTRALLERSRDVGLSVLAGATVTARDLVVRDTTETDCGSECASWAGGVGIGVYDDASFEVTGIRIERADVCGVQLANGASVTLSDGDVSGCDIGACVQVPDYDLTRLTNDVAFHDNGANLEATDLPVPVGLTSVDSTME
ncbi:MAG: hypothetical protein JRH11_19765 [Deltaproteobacteria bacterium]|nr:hypothetical protein [Deltaproteobacteria bacterium]